MVIFAALRPSKIGINTMERHSLIFLSVLVLFSLACGLLEDEDTNVTYPVDFSKSFSIDADQLCPDCPDETAPAPSDRELDPIEFAAEIDIVEQTGRSELRDYTNAFRSIEITRIDYAVAGNDLTFDLPPTTLYLAPMGVDSKDHEDAVKLATIPATGVIAAGENKSGKAKVADEGRSASSELLQNLELSTILFAQPVVKEGQPLPPSGSASMKVTIFVEFTANPQDAI
jgi:hypothetical protein